MLYVVQTIRFYKFYNSCSTCQAWQSISIICVSVHFNAVSIIHSIWNIDILFHRERVPGWWRMIGQSEKFDAIHHPSVIITNFGAKFMDKCKMSSPISDHKITTDSHTIFNVFKFLALTRGSKSSYLCLLPESSSKMSRAPSTHLSGLEPVL